MRNVRTGKRPFGTVRFLNILIVVTALAAGVCLIRMVGELRSAFDRDRYSGLEYSLQEGEYADMIRQYYARFYDVAPFASAHEEAYHVAGYADAAFRCRFYEVIGKREQAEALSHRMAQDRDGCGSLSVAADDIDRLLAGIPMDLEEDHP